jgi:hypothetical protein
MECNAIASKTTEEEYMNRLKTIPKTTKKQRFIDEHERLENLFITDRFAFELERKRLLHESINHTHHREKLQKQQDEWDRILNGIGSADNRFAMIQSLFWYHLVNNWQPELQESLATLKTLVRGNCNQPVLSLLK